MVVVMFLLCLTWINLVNLAPGHQIAESLVEIRNTHNSFPLAAVHPESTEVSPEQGGTVDGFGKCDSRFPPRRASPTHKRITAALLRPAYNITTTRASLKTTATHARLVPGT